jgi:hypothetical protein
MLSASATAQRARQLDAAGDTVPNSSSVLGSVRGAVPIVGRTLMGMTRLTVEGPRPDRTGSTSDPSVVWDLVFSGDIERTGVHYNLGLYNLADWKYDAPASGEFRQRTILQNGRTVLAQISASF